MNLKSEIKTVSKLSPHLRQWIATCLIDGFNVEVISKKLALYIADGDDARSEVEAVQDDPVMTATKPIRQKYAKLTGLLDVLARQYRNSDMANGVPVETGIIPERFFSDYYFANKPVVIRELMEDWPAMKIWCPSLFAERYGNITIETTADRNSDPKYEDRFAFHRKQMLMSEFIKLISSDAGNNVYVVAKNRLLEQPEFKDLLGEFEYPVGFLNQKRANQLPRLWIGGKGTMTPLHHDASNIFFGQVYGRKRVWLIPPVEIGNVYNDRTCFSAVDIEDPDPVLFPRMRNVLTLEVIVEPGDFLFLPIGWWHAVRSLDISISLSFQNFDIREGVLVWNHSY